MKPQNHLVIYFLIVSSANDSFMVKVRDTDTYKFEYNEELMNLTFLNGNRTHDGGAWVNLYDDLPELIYTIKVASNQKTFIDQTVNLCNWIKNPRVNWGINVFNNYYNDLYAPELFKCPVKKGIFMAVSVKLRRKDFNFESLAPAIVRTKNNNFTVVTFVHRV